MLRHYLDGVRTRLTLDPSGEGEIVRELYTHLEDRSQELQQAGLSEEQADEAATRHFGYSGDIAREMNQVHLQGTWHQALLAATPHLLFALLFALHLWQSAIWSSALLICITGVTAYGWRHGKPVWLFSWLGYSLLPVVVSGIFLLFLPGEWAWLALSVYILLTLRLLSLIAIQTVGYNWLYGSLALQLLPISAGWFLAVYHQGEFMAYDEQYLDGLSGWMALSLLTMAVTVAAFIRLSERRLKVGILLASEFLILVLVTLHTENGLGFLGSLMLVLSSMALLLSPALLGHVVGYSKQRVESWNHAWLERTHPKS